MVNGQNFMDELNKFAGNIQGDPRQQVQNLLNNGQMSQQTYSRYQKIAEQIQSGNAMQAIMSLFGR